MCGVGAQLSCCLACWKLHKTERGGIYLQSQHSGGRHWQIRWSSPRMAWSMWDIGEGVQTSKVWGKGKKGNGKKQLCVCAEISPHTVMESLYSKTNPFNLVCVFRQNGGLPHLRLLSKADGHSTFILLRGVSITWADRCTHKAAIPVPSSFAKEPKSTWKQCATSWVEEGVQFQL